MTPIMQMLADKIYLKIIYDPKYSSPTWKGGDEFSLAEEGVVALFYQTNIIRIRNSGFKIRYCGKRIGFFQIPYVFLA